MSDINVATLSAMEFREGIAKRDFSAVEVTDAALARIDALDPSVHAFNQVTPELAYTAAEKIDAAVRGGAGAADLPPLAGVPADWKG